MAFKIANVICRFNSSSGGPPRTVALIAQAGIGLWQAELFTTNYMESHSDTLLVAEFPGHVTLLPSIAQTPRGSIARALGFAQGMRTQLVQGSRPQVVHLHGLWSPLLLAYARISKRAGIPYIVAPHGMLEPWSLTIHPRRKKFALNTYQGSVLSGAAAIHTTSDAEAKHVRELGFRRAPIYVIPNAVSEAGPIPARSPALPGAPHVLLFLSRVHEKKGLDILLQAWNELRPSKWELRIVGHGEPAYVATLKRRCSEQRTPNVQFYDHVDGQSRESMFAEASAFVLPTYSENFGNVVAEAMVRGLPVITTTGTPWSVIVEKKLGWYVQPTCGHLKSSLLELFRTESTLLREMGIRAQEYARTNLLVSAVRPRLLEMYSSTLLH